jgi:hypothetical protein
MRNVSEGGVGTMKQKRVFLGILFVVFWLAFWGNQLQAQEIEEPGFVLVGHTSVSETLSEDEVKQIFLGRMTRKDGHTLVFVIFKEKKVYSEFLKTYIGKTITQYANYWKKQVFTGKGRMPKMFSESTELLEFIESHEGALGFLPSEKLPLKDADKTLHIITIIQQ